MSRFSRATFGAHQYSLSLVAAAACWGTATVISKRAVEEIQPLTLLPIELAISVAVLTVAVRFAPNPTPTPVRRREHVVLGIVNPGISYAAQPRRSGAYLGEFIGVAMGARTAVDLRVGPCGAT